MKKLFFFVILSGVAFTLKAQQKTDSIFSKKLTLPGFHPKFDTIGLNYPVKPKNDINSLFLPKQKLPATGVLYASLDRMPILKPVGKWSMPVVHPNGTVVYTMPVKRLPPVFNRPDSTAQKPRP